MQSHPTLEKQQTRDYYYLHMAVPRGSDARCGNCCQDMRWEGGPLLPTFVIYWPKLAADAEVVNVEHAACSALPIPGPRLHATARSRHCEEVQGDVY